MLTHTPADTDTARSLLSEQEASHRISQYQTALSSQSWQYWFVLFLTRTNNWGLNELLPQINISVGRTFHLNVSHFNFCLPTAWRIQFICSAVKITGHQRLVCNLVFLCVFHSLKQGHKNESSAAAISQERKQSTNI